MGKPIQNFTPNLANRPPWGDLSGKLHQYIEGEGIPAGVTDIRDPSVMGLPRNKAWVQHWYDRQSAGLVPLQFHSYRGPKGIQPRVPRRKLVEDVADLPRQNQRRENAAEDDTDGTGENAVSGDWGSDEEDEMPQVRKKSKSRKTSSKKKAKKPTAKTGLRNPPPATDHNAPGPIGEGSNTTKRGEGHGRVSGAAGDDGSESMELVAQPLTEDDEMPQVMGPAKAGGSGESWSAVENVRGKPGSARENGDPTATDPWLDTAQAVPLHEGGPSGPPQRSALQTSNQRQAASSSIVVGALTPVLTPERRARRTGKRTIVISPSEDDDEEPEARTFPSGLPHSPLSTRARSLSFNNSLPEPMAPTLAQSPASSQAVAALLATLAATVQNSENPAASAAISELVKDLPSHTLVERLLRIQIEASSSKVPSTPTGEVAVSEEAERQPAAVEEVEIGEPAEDQPAVFKPASAVTKKRKRGVIDSEAPAGDAGPPLGGVDSSVSRSKKGLKRQKSPPNEGDIEAKRMTQARRQAADALTTPIRVGARQRKPVERHWPEDPRKGKGKSRAKGK